MLFFHEVCEREYDGVLDPSACFFSVTTEFMSIECCVVRLMKFEQDSDNFVKSGL
jgi:hypothetical protein